MRTLRAASALAAWLVGAVAVGAVPPALDEPPPPPPPPPQARLPIPEPDLSAMGSTAKRQIEFMQQAARALQDRQPAQLPALTEAFARLGQVFYAVGLYDAAQTSFENADTLLPDYRWWYYLALTHHAGGDLEEAAAAYRRVIEAGPTYAAARIRLGQVLLEIGRLDEASGHFEEALKREPENAAALAGLGEIAFQRDAAAEAATLFERALVAAPGATSLHYSLGQAYRKLGDAERARRHLALQGDGKPPFEDPLSAPIATIRNTFALELIPEMVGEESFTEENFIGYVMSRFAQAPGAIDYLRGRLEQMEEGSPEAHLARLRFALGGLLAAQGRDEEAVEELSRAVELEPALQEARLRLSKALARLGRFEEAVASYDELLERRPDLLPALLQRAAAQVRLQRLDEARQDLERAVAVAPGSAEAKLDLGRVLELAGEAERAAALYREVAAAGSPGDDVRGHLALARHHERRGDLPAAMGDYQRALQADPESREGMMGMGRAFGATGRYADAATTFRRLSEVEPRAEAARAMEATALILGGAHAEARERLEAGLEILPDSRELQRILARHLAASPDRSVRDGRRALDLAEQLYEVEPTPASVETLAMAYAEAGDLEQAIEWQRKLLEKVEAWSNSADYDRMKANLELYERGEPCCAAGE